MASGMRWTEADLENFIARGLAAQRAVAPAPPADRRKSEPEERLWRQLRRLRAKARREHVFHALRGWRFDFAIPSVRLAIEIEGGVRMIGRHQRPDGFLEDCRKYNAAALGGWRVLRFTPEQLMSGEAAEIIALALERKKP